MVARGRRRAESVERRGAYGGERPPLWLGASVVSPFRPPVAGLSPGRHPPARISPFESRNAPSGLRRAPEDYTDTETQRQQAQGQYLLDERGRAPGKALFRRPAAVSVCRRFRATTSWQSLSKRN
jgi:hypothetical protein